VKFARIVRQSMGCFQALIETESKKAFFLSGQRHKALEKVIKISYY
jgi:hypothetical protein